MKTQFRAAHSAVLCDLRRTDSLSRSALQESLPLRSVSRLRARPGEALALLTRASPSGPRGNPPYELQGRLNSFFGRSWKLAARPAEAFPREDNDNNDVYLQSTENG